MKRLFKVYELQLMLALLGLIAALLIMTAILPELSTGTILFLFALFWLPLLALLFKHRRIRRHAWRRAYLHETSPLQFWLQGGLLMMLGQVIASGLLALALLVSLARETPPGSWVLLLILVPIWSLFFSPLRARLSRHLSPQILSVYTASLMRWLCAGALLMLLTVAALWQPVTDLREVTLSEAIQYFSLKQYANSRELQWLLQLVASVEGGMLWLAQNKLNNLSSDGLRLLGWGLVLVQKWLFIWPLLLLWEALTLVIYRRESELDRNS